MSYIYLQEQGEVSSAECFSDIPAFVLSRLNLTAEKSCSNASETESSPSSQSGTMCEPLTVNRGEDSLTLCAGGSHARTFHLGDGVPESLESEAGCGQSSSESFAKFDRDTVSWRTRQRSFFAEWADYLETWPLRGWMLNGECFVLPTLAVLMGGEDVSFWPTPTKIRKDGSGGASRRDNVGGSGARKKSKRNGTFISGIPNPRLQEWLMAWPLNWTNLTPLETAKFQQWLRSHGKSLPE
jgi:hypothetical protein